MTESTLCGKCIRTYKGNLLCCIEVRGREFFFAMNPMGLRFLFKNESQRGKYLTSKEWDNALETWEDSKGNPVKVETLTGTELSNAMRLGKEIANDFTFNMSLTEKQNLPANHMTRF